MATIAAQIFYREEKVWLKEAFGMILSDDVARIIHQKICRHLKKNIKLRFHGHNGGGRAWYHEIAVCHNPHLGLLIHEIGHIQKSFLDDNNDNFAHDWRLKEIMIGLFNYCKKKNFWDAEVKRRLAPKEKKPKEKKSKDEIRILKIEKKKELLKKYNRKIKYYTTLKKKAMRSLKGMETYVRRSA
jgi:hypothetical protein